jgi:hypothetical protein
VQPARQLGGLRTNILDGRTCLRERGPEQPVQGGEAIAELIDQLIGCCLEIDSLS